MEKIFSYLDYREFMEKRFVELKKTKRGITHRSLSKKAGFSSPNFLKLVMIGERNLTATSIPQVCKAFDLGEKESEFFEKLVHFNQARNIEEKERAYQAIKTLRHDLSLKRIEHSQYEYFEHWYCVAIRELVGVRDFQEDPAWISERLDGEVSLTEIKRTLQLLERLGLIERDENGKLKQSQKPISPGNEIASLVAYRFHQQMIQRAKDALYRVETSKRDISSITIPLSQPLFEEIRTRILNFRREILALVQNCEEADTVYQLNLQFFNLSRIVWNNSSEKSS